MTLQDDVRKAWFKSKTMLFNLLLVLSGLAGMLQPVVEELAATGMDPETVAVLRVVLMTVGIVGMFLRQMTAGGVKVK